MHFIVTVTVLAVAAFSRSWASPVGATTLTLFNGEKDVAAQLHTSPTTERRSPLAPGDNIDCKGHSVLCTSLGGPQGQCAAASRLIYTANTYSTTGK